MWQLLSTFSWQELRHHPWRSAAAVVSVMLGVALAFSVQLINASALDEFSRGMRSVGGQADLEVRGAAGSPGVPQGLLSLLWAQSEVAAASPVLEQSVYAQAETPVGVPGAAIAASGELSRQNRRVLLRLVGVDVLQVGSIAPDLLPQPTGAAGAATDWRYRVFAPDALFLNAAARAALAGPGVLVQKGMQLLPLQIAGSVRASGAATGVMDIAALQDLLGSPGTVSRIDLRLHAGADPTALVRRLQALPQWPAGVQLQAPADPAQRMGNLSRAYRVNMTVLALIALFTGGFLVFSVLALSVARRAQQFALLGVLGLTGGQRLQLILLEAALLGGAGSAAGIALGTGLAALALQLLGGDLGGGYFSSATPALQWSGLYALAYASLGMCTALAGAWWPARMAQRLAPAQTLKGLGTTGMGPSHSKAGFILLLVGAALALLPPIGGIALAAYLSVACMLTGGIVALPWLVGAVLDQLAPWSSRSVVALLAIERARRVRHTAAVAVSGVVASLSLAVALTVMVGSFRDSVTQWLDSVLPAALYVRTSGSSSANESAFFTPDFVSAAASVPGVQRVNAQRTLALQLDPALPNLALIARTLRETATAPIQLPLVGETLPVPQGRIGIYVSEAVVDLYGVRIGQGFAALERSLQARASAAAQAAGTAISVPAPDMLFVAGIWRDYARQFGTVAIAPQDLARWVPDAPVSDLAFWLQEGASVDQLQQDLRALAERLASRGTAAGNLLEFGSAQQIRATTLRIFDRSFAVTYWLQAVAIGIGLFGVAASFSAQVLARRKEFGLLAHLGLTRAQILRLVAAEGAAWTGLGALAGVALGLAVSVVLVHVVNPQSFHWTMELSLPWLRLLALAAAVVAAGTLTAWLSARAAAAQDAVLAVKEDW